MTETKETLREFCAGQVQRLSLFRRFDFLEVQGRKEIRNWLEAKGDNRPAITALIDAAVLLDEMPTLADLRRIWAEQNPPMATASASCPHCSGTGFEIVRRGDLEGARRCRCGGVPLSDPSVAYVGPVA